MNIFFINAYLNKNNFIDQPTMDKIYNNPAHPAAYGGVRALQRASGNSRSKVKKYLNENATYRKYKKNITNFKRARIHVTSIGHIYQSDLFDLQKLSRSNNGYRYILLVVDCFSRMIYARPIKRKSAELVAVAMRDIFDKIKQSGVLSARVMMGSDLGTDLWNSEVDKVYDHFNISHYALRAPKKASLAEVSGRYLLDRLYKHLHATDSKRWIDDLQKFVEAKNNRINKSLGGLSPAEVNFENQFKVYDSLYPNHHERHESKHPPLEVGQKVQMALDRMPFSKSFKGYFSDKVYKVLRTHDHNGIYRYTLVDTGDDQEISGTYYNEELLPL